MIGNLLETLLDFLWNMFSWIYRGIYHVCSGIFYSWIRNFQVVFTWLGVAALWMLVGANKILDYFIEFILINVSELVTASEYDLDFLSNAVEISGQAVWVGERYVGLIALSGILTAYFSFLVAVYVTKFIVRLIPTVG